MEWERGAWEPVIHVGRVDELSIASKVVLVKLEDWEVLEHDVLHSRNVSGANPVLGGGAHKALETAGIVHSNRSRSACQHHN